MGLLGEVQAAQHVTRCRVAVIKEGLDPQDADDLDVALSERDESGNYRYALRTIINILRRRDMQVSEKVLSRHRKGDCGCPRG